MREPVTTIGSKLVAFSGESAAGAGSVAGAGPSARAAETVNPAIAPVSSSVVSTRVGLLQNPGNPCVARPSTWCCFSILLPMIVIATPDAPSAIPVRHQASHHGPVQLSGSCQAGEKSGPGGR